jgi:hypothetical protein
LFCSFAEKSTYSQTSRNVFKAQQIIAQRFTEFHTRKRNLIMHLFRHNKSKNGPTPFREKSLNFQSTITPRAAADQFFGFMKV